MEFDQYLNSRLNYWVLKGEEVYHVSVPVVPAPVLNGRTVLVYEAQVKELASFQTDPKNVIVGEIAISQFRRAERNVIVVRAVYDLLGTMNYDCQLGSPELDALLKGEKASKETIRYEILAYIIRRVDEHPGRLTTVLELIAAVRRPLNELIESLNNLEARARLQVHHSKGGSAPNTFDDIVSSDDYGLTHDYFHTSIIIPPEVKDKVKIEVEEHRKRTQDSLTGVKPRILVDDHRYYKLLGTSAELDGDFAFMLMPFNEKEFPQAIYHEVIKPLVKDVLGINCQRVDEDPTSQNAQDKIYSHIVKAKLVIVEVSTQNPNVMFEFGQSTILEKDFILICFNKTAVNRDKKLAFDFANIHTHFYDDPDELRQKLRAALDAFKKMQPKQVT